MKTLGFLPALLLAAPVSAQLVPVPARPATPGAAVTSPERWVPSRTACVEATRPAGAIVIDPRLLELVSTRGDRVRLIFAEDCAHLSYYGGFYYKPGEDGQLCAGRDVLMGREGGACRIKEIATPRPARARPKPKSERPR
ncbi:hypothetical protein [Thermaurantiacus sp.]